MLQTGSNILHNIISPFQPVVRSDISTLVVEFKKSTFLPMEKLFRGITYLMICIRDHNYNVIILSLSCRLWSVYANQNLKKNMGFDIPYYQPHYEIKTGSNWQCLDWVSMNIKLL